ncbi:MAG: glyoxalase superfamily protein [Ferruginibacter sp.]
MSIIKPIFRIFDYQKTIEFYKDWLGFTIDWEHTFAENTPIYMQVSMGDILLHLSEHHGDCSPGAQIHIMDFEGLEAYHKLLIEKNYRYNKPGIEKASWNADLYTMEVTDPFSNRMIFSGK